MKWFTDFFFVKLKMKWTDFLMLFGAGFAIPVLFERANLLRVHNPTETVLPIWLLSLFFACTLVLFGIYLYFERKSDFIKVHPALLIGAIILLVLVSVTTFIQPDEIHNIIYIQNPNIGNVGDSLDVVTTISYKIRIVVFYNLILFAIALYLAIVVLPRRFKEMNLKVLEVACLVLYFVLFCSVIYSLIAEYSSYVYLFKFIRGQVDVHELEIHAPMGMFTHRNVNGMFMVLAIFSSLFGYELSKNKYHFIATGFFSINLIFTICKTGIIITIVSLVMYLIYKMIVLYKHDKKKGIIGLSITSGALLLVIIIGVILFLAVPSINEKVTNLFRGGETLKSRVNIWQTAFAMLKPAWWITGKGYWIFDITMRECNWAAQNDTTGSPHNWFIGFISRGGILMVGAYLFLMGYTIKKLIELSKFDKDFTFVLGLGLLAFLIYSNFEDYYYVTVIISIITMFVLNHLKYQSAKSE